jgi:hypothetical protein
MRCYYICFRLFYGMSVQRALICTIRLLPLKTCLDSRLAPRQQASYTVKTTPRILSSNLSTLCLLSSSDRSAEILADPNLQKFQRATIIITENFTFNVFMALIVAADFILVALRLDATINITWGYYLTIVENILLGIFTFEVIVRTFARRATIIKSYWPHFGKFIIG